jgi:hypothetical protein
MKTIEDIKQLPHYLDDNGKAITLTSQIARDIFAYMQAKFQRGDGNGHSDWIENQMFAIINREYLFYMPDIHKQVLGWEVLVAKGLPRENNNFFVVFYKQNELMGAVKVNAPIESEASND